MRTKTSSLWLNNNTFTNNTCREKGGVFYFISVNLDVVCSQNEYINNYAGDSGGVGYIFNTHLNFSESDSIYLSK